MRLERLDLQAYGHFSGRTLDFSPPARLHVVYGPNEAGKSTTLAAIIDLLFGFKAKDHPYTFLHPKPLLGGEVSGPGAARLAFVRQRTRGGAGLTTPDGKKSLPDDALDGFLTGIGKEEFLRLCALDQAGLRAGGAEMLNPDSDIGRKLFAAGTGLGDLHRVETGLAAAIDRIGGVKGRQDQRLTAAARGYKLADDALKAASLKAGELSRARDRLAAATAAAQAAQTRLTELAAEQARLRRAQRVRPLLAELDRLCAAAGGDVAPSDRPAPPDLPAGLAEQWRGLVQQTVLAEAEWTRCVAAQQAAAATLAAAPTIGPFLALARPVAELAAGLGAYDKAGRDLPGRRAERRAKADALAAALTALGLDPAGEHRPPGEVDAAAARHLANRRRECRLALVNGEKQRDRAQVEADAAALALNELGPAADAGAARRLAQDAAALHDAPARLETAETALRAAETAAAQALAALVGLGRWSGDGAALDALTPPPAAAISAFDNSANELKNREQAADASRQELETERIDVVARIEAAQAVGEPPGSRAVETARRRRDLGVALLTAAAHGAADAAAIAAYAGAGDLGEAVAAAVTAADQLADRRIAEAKRAQTYEAALERCAALTARLARLTDQQAALATERAALAAGWRAAWSPVQAGPAAEMRDWRAAYHTAQEARRRAQDAAAAQDAAQQRYQRWAALWRAVAAALSLPLPPSDDGTEEHAAALARRAQDALEAVERQAEQRRDLTARRQTAAERAADAARDIAAQRAELAALDRDWATLVPRLGQPADLSEGALETVLSRWADAAAALKARDELDHRIRGMEQDRAAFEGRVAALRDELAGRGVALPTDPAAALAAAQAGVEADRNHQTVLAEKRQALTAREQETAAAGRRREDVAAAARALRAAHGLDDGADIIALCAVADVRRRLTLAGDGRDEATLRRESAADAADADAARLAALAGELAAAQEANDASRTELGQAQADIARLDQEAGAEAAARQRNEAARRAGLAADELLQLRAAQLLLRRTVERYRDENQDPLLSRASALLAAVAGAGGGDPIIRLESRVGDDNRPALHAIRRGGGAVTLAGLSEGTADQLFLALRLAALEQRAAAGRALPFIADDIFMTSDDARAAAGLRALAELGRTTQVIVFTHHDSVANAAEAAADGAVNRINLAG